VVTCNHDVLMGNAKSNSHGGGDLEKLLRESCFQIVKYLEMLFDGAGVDGFPHGELERLSSPAPACADAPQ
jgi:hypothetical protein